MARKLIYVPMIHNPFAGEMGESARKLVEIKTAQLDPSLKQHFIQEQANYWNQVDEYLATMPRIDKIYHDGISDFNLESFIVLFDSEILKESGNDNAVRRLRKRGSRLMPTEANELFLKSVSDDILARDIYIADTIGETLQDNETGVLFMGFEHNVQREIRERYPDINVYNVPVGLSNLALAYKTLNLQLFPGDKDSIEELVQSALRRLETTPPIIV